MVKSGTWLVSAAPCGQWTEHQYGSYGPPDNQFFKLGNRISPNSLSPPSTWSCPLGNEAMFLNNLYVQICPFSGPGCPLDGTVMYDATNSSLSAGSQRLQQSFIPGMGPQRLIAGSGDSFVFIEGGDGKTFVPPAGCPDPSPAPDPTPAPDTTAAPLAGVQIQSTVSSLCVDLPGGDASNGALLWTWDCYGGDTQQWAFQDGQLVYLPDPSKCVDLLGGDTTNGNRLGIWDCGQGDSQMWGFDSEWGTIYLASSVGSDATKCAQIGGENKGDPLVIWDCTTEPQQVWTVGSPQFSFAVV